MFSHHINQRNEIRLSGGSHEGVSTRCVNVLERVVSFASLGSLLYTCYPTPQQRGWTRFCCGSGDSPHGRPQSVSLAVLIDRRFSRELPIEPNYIGKHVDSIGEQHVKVEWSEDHGEDRVILLNSKPA